MSCATVVFSQANQCFIDSCLMMQWFYLALYSNLSRPASLIHSYIYQVRTPQMTPSKMINHIPLLMMKLNEVMDEVVVI